MVKQLQELKQENLKNKNIKKILNTRKTEC